MSGAMLFRRLKGWSFDRRIAKEVVLRRNASFNKQIKYVLKEYILLGSIYTKEEINKILTTVVTRLNLKRGIK